MIIEKEIGGKKLSLEYGKVAAQANGAVLVRYEETVLLSAVTSADEPKEGCDFFPLTVEYQERFYAAGKIPGGFFRREGRSSEREILCCRLIDRPIRPLFPEDYRNEVQIVVTVLSVDDNLPDVLGVIGTSAALLVSDIPFDTGVGTVRVGMNENGFIINPSFQEREKSPLDMVICGTSDKILMIETRANELPEQTILDAIDFAKPVIKEIIELQSELQKAVGKPKKVVPCIIIDENLCNQIQEFAFINLKNAIFVSDKTLRDQRMAQVRKETIEYFAEIFPDNLGEINTILDKIEKKIIRQSIIEEQKRVDGRKLTEIRPISCEIGILPRTHGSALFTRGQTQTLAVTTLGTSEDEQMLDNIEGKTFKRFLLHYNFPPFSVGEARPLRGPGRREIGHGALAEKSLLPVLPSVDKFPYTIRIVSDILESNGSTSMASVCGGCLSLMDAGVPISSPVAGISIGLVKEGDKSILFTDITGIEDGNGDMDFKVAGTRHGITGIQVDLKIDGIERDLITKILEDAKTARNYILDEMAKVIAQSKDNISNYAPRILSMTVPIHKIREIIGPGGKVIKHISAITGAKINIDDEGKVTIASVDEQAAINAIEMINAIIAEAEVDKNYLGKVMRVTNFGAFVEILPGKEGLVHISQLADFRVNKVEDIVNEGDEIIVKVIGIDEMGRINLSRKAILQEEKH